MASVLSDGLLEEVSEFVADQMGLSFPKERWPDLARGIGSATQAFHFKDTLSCIDWLTSSPLTKSQIETLASYLTIGETYFFREGKSFQILEEQILPDLIYSARQTERRLRIWSAGCCTGEEAYSLAILLDKLIPDFTNWNILLLATDINPLFLQRASDGLYGESAFRETPPAIRERYFKKRKEGLWEIHREIKKKVTLSYLNLAADPYPSLINNTNAMDLILCRNVLIYFTPDSVKRVAENFHRSLIDGGWLIVSPIEASHVVFSRFTTVPFPGAILYKKARGSPQSRSIEEAPSFKWIGETKERLPLPSDLDRTPPPQENFDWSATVPLKEEPPECEVEADLYQEALALQEQGQYADALSKITALLSEKANHAPGMALMARVYANLGKLTEALHWCKMAVAADRTNPGYYYLLATILEEQGETEYVSVSLKQALYLDPRFILAHFTLGNLPRRQGKFKESQRHFRNAQSLLMAHPQDLPLPMSEGITAERLAEIIRSTARGRFT